MKQGKVQKAEKIYEKIAALIDLLDYDFYLKWANCLTALKKFDKAIEKCDKGIEVRKKEQGSDGLCDHGSIYRSWAEELINQKKYHEAIDKIENAKYHYPFCWEKQKEKSNRNQIYKYENSDSSSDTLVRINTKWLVS